MKKQRNHSIPSFTGITSTLKQKQCCVLALALLSSFHLMANNRLSTDSISRNTAIETAANINKHPNDLFYTLNNKHAVLNIIVKGKVVDEKGEGLTGANVVIEGTTQGVAADINGEYQLSVPEGSTLVFSFMGYVSQKVVVGNQTKINVALQLDAVGKKLNDVVIVGYGTQKRSDITGSVSSVPKERLSELPVTNVMQAVEGTTAGLNISENSSTPGSSPKVLVRGANSINASTSPLIVVDGVPFSNLGGSMNDINPNDIASIEILKDASAVAIYGTRGSSGVILITTKRGKTGKPTIRYSAFGGPEFQHETLTPLNGQQYVQKYLDYSQQMNLIPNNPPVPNLNEIPNYNSGTTTDWLKTISQQGYIQDHNLSLSGGTENIKYFISGEYQNEKGVLKGYQHHRAAVRSNIDANITDWLTVGTSLFFSKNNNDGGTANYSLAMQQSPYGQVYDAKGNYTIYPMFPETLYTNPLLGLNTDVVNRYNDLNGTFYLEVKPKFLSGLKFRVNANYTNLPTINDTYSGLSAGNTVGGTAMINNTGTDSWLVENILSYNKDWKKHHLDITTLYSAQEKVYTSSTITGSTFVNDDLSFNNLGSAGVVTGASFYSRDALLSQMGRINYSYDSKYLFTATARRDGYSAFGSATSKYGFFPSVALGWNISEEKFLKKVDQIDNIKLRLSYGTSGNQAVGAYQTITTQGVTKYIYNGTPTTGLVSSSLNVNGVLGNVDLNWESTTGANLGIDFSLFKSRISGSLEVYSTKTKNLLLNRLLPAIGGYPSVLDNLGSLANKGLEATLTTVNIKGDKFTWSTNFNFSANRNKIISLYGNNTDDLVNKWFIGKPLGAIYDYKLAGVWQVGQDASKIDPGAKPGDLKFVDENGDGKITAADKVYQGSSLPKWNGGMINNFGYKNFHLSVFVQTSQGAIINNPTLDLQNYGGRVNIPVQLDNYWTAANQSNTRPSLSYINPRLYAYPVPQNFTRLKDITFSYTLPQAMADKLKVGSLTAYISGRDIYTFTKWIGLDPELSVNANQSGPANANLSYGLYPLVASYVLGVNISLR
ncbi:MAG: TonB-dependent receptor [Mucilaginibacter sp.]|nr:TonB-dependent receptor [Mucilaginibacter sp.]